MHFLCFLLTCELLGVSTRQPEGFYGLPTASLGMLSSVYKWCLFFIASHPVFAVNNTIQFFVAGVAILLLNSIRAHSFDIITSLQTLVNLFK